MDDSIQQEICKTSQKPGLPPRKGFECVGLNLVADLYKRGAFDNISSAISAKKRKVENSEENVCKLVKMNAEAWENRRKFESRVADGISKPREKKNNTEISETLKNAYLPSEIWENEETCEQFSKNPIIHKGNIDFQQNLEIPEVYQVCEEKIEPKTCTFLWSKAEEEDNFKKFPEIPLIHNEIMDFPKTSEVSEVYRIEEPREPCTFLRTKSEEEETFDKFPEVPVTYEESSMVPEVMRTQKKTEVPHKKPKSDLPMEKWLCKPYFFFNKKPEKKKVVKILPKIEKIVPKKVEVINLRKFLPEYNRNL